jgi:phosphohistidine phosphatase
MKLYLLRHGIAARPEDVPQGSDRPLTQKGAKRMRKGARGLRRLDLKFERICTSPLARAQETANIVAESLGDEGLLVTLETLKPESTVDELLASLAQFDGTESLLLVGHEPLLSDAAAHFVAGTKTARFAIELKKGGLIGIELDGLPPREPGNLELLATPRMLRLLGARG